MDTKDNKIKNTSKKNTIFISYRHSNKDFVDNIVKHLLCKNVFYDDYDLKCNQQTFDTQLKNQIKDSRAIVPILTKEYLTAREGIDWCAKECKFAIKNNIPIIPVYVDDFINVKDDNKFLLKDTVVNYHTKSICKRNDDPKEIADKIWMSVCNTFCMLKDYSKFVEYLDTKIDILNKTELFTNTNVKLKDSFVELSLLKKPTNKEKKVAEKNKKIAESINVKIEEILKEKYAIVVGDAGQGKSSIAKYLYLNMAEDCKYYDLSRDNYYPVFVECKRVNIADNNIETALAKAADIDPIMLSVLLEKGQVYLILDGMDEVSTTQMSEILRLIESNDNIAKSNIKILFTSRPGEFHIINDRELEINNTTVRRFDVDTLDDKQQEKYCKNIVKYYNDINLDELLTKLREKEEEAESFKVISRNPLILMNIIDYYSGHNNLPNTKVEAIDNSVSKLLDRDVAKDNAQNVNESEVLLALGVIAEEYYLRKSKNQVFDFNEVSINKLITRYYPLRDDLIKKNVCKFLKDHNYYNESGFKHSIYVDYYLSYYFYEKLQEDKDYKIVNQAIVSNEEYWESAIEMMLCYIDRESRDSLILENLLTKMQHCETPNYDLLCRSINQFVEYCETCKSLLVDTMIKRGANGILHAKIEKNGVYICDSSEYGGYYCVNPYEELYKYVVINDYGDSLKRISINTNDNSDLIKIQRYFVQELSEYLETNTLVTDIAIEECLKQRLQSASSSNRNADKEDVRGFVIIPKGTKIIERYAFFGYSDITSIIIPNSVESIGDWAFRNSNNVTSITIPNSVKSIGDHAFNNCRSLISIIIPNSVECIGDYAFYNCSILESITIGDRVKQIGVFAFAGCSCLSSITIPNRVTSIGSRAFYGCSSLESIEVDENNTKYHSEGNCLVETSTKTLILGCNNSAIPTDGSVESIGDSAFYDCSILESITIGDRVKQIGVFAFAGCSSLTSITIPGSVTSIGDYAFLDCSGLTSITIEYGVTSIGACAFSCCISLTSITIPDSITRIGGDLFLDCIGLTSIIYNGTRSQWNAIVKEYFFDSWIDSYTIHCIDGDITKYHFDK